MITKIKNKIKNLTFKGMLKSTGKFFLNTFTMATISIGTLGLFISYINPTAYIAQQFPNLQIGAYTLETLFTDVKYWQSLGYIAWSISGGTIALGLAMHIRSIGKVIRAIKASPRAIINFPMNTYKKVRAGRDWLLTKIN